MNFEILLIDKAKMVQIHDIRRLLISRQLNKA